MSTGNVGFQTVVELASHLSPEDRLRLITWIGAEMNQTSAGHEAGTAQPGTSAAVIRVMRGAPRLSSEDVDELERAIAAGRLPMRRQGVFETGSDP
jgi:hypothetical protein